MAAMNRWGWFFGMAMGGTIAFSASCAISQVIPDGTLPNNSIVTPQGSTRLIEGGTQAGSNLFHSFQEFSVPPGGTAFFNNTLDIQNIISRVTGGSASNIDGIIRANGTANLFLINPNGIVFGRNASLNIGGSFVATTANAIGFGNQGFFSATNPNTPPLLSVNPTAFFFNQIAAARIQNNSVAPPAEIAPIGLPTSGLRVPDGQSLLLVGGEISMNGGRLNALGGRVELGGLVGLGSVGLISNGNSFSLSFAPDSLLSDVFLANDARVSVRGVGGGDIAVNANTFTATDGGRLVAGTEAQGNGGDITVNASRVKLSGIGSSGVGAGLYNQAPSGAVGNIGNIFVNAESIEAASGARIENSLLSGAVGKGGNITISAASLSLTDGAELFTSTSGRGNATSVNVGVIDSVSLAAGNLTIKTNALLVKGGAIVGAITSGAGQGGNLRVDAQDVQVIGGSANGPSGLLASAQRNSTGDAGDLTIKTNTLLVKDGAVVSASTSGSGQAGNLKIDAQDVQLIGTNANGLFSGLRAAAQSNSTGDAGDLTIKTNTLLVKDGSQVSTGTFGSGQGGNLRVDAQDVQLIGSFNGQLPSGLFSATERNSGDAGDLTIKTNTLLVKDGAVVGAGTSGSGQGGNLKIDAQDVQVIGTTANGRFPSSLRTAVELDSTGDAGNLTIKTNTLLVKDGSQVNTGTFGSGKGGNLKVDAQDVQLIGTTANGQFPSGLFSAANRSGDAGDLTIKTNTLLVKDGAVVGAGTSGSGQGGNLKIDAQDVQVIGTTANGRFPSSLRTAVEFDSTGDAGDLTIKTNTLLVQDGAAVTVQSLGTGTAGNMTLNARSIRLNNNASLSANTQSAFADPNREQATIKINSQLLLISRNSNIRTNARGENVIGGNINIDTDFLIAVDNSDISANSANFRGGNVRINAFGIFGTQFRDVASEQTSDITATGASPEFGGTVELNTPEIDPNSGLINLPSVPVDTEVAQGCSTPNSAQSSFTITGRGGLPPNPKEVLTPDAVQVDWVTRHPEIEQSSKTNISPNPTSPAPTSIVEATGWAFGSQGEVMFTAQALPVQHQNSWQPSPKCHAN